MAKQLEITLVKSTLGASPRQRKTAEALGLKKYNQTVVKERKTKKEEKQKLKDNLLN